MYEKSLKKYSSSLPVIVIVAFAAFVVQCERGHKTEVIEMDDVIPAASRAYDYEDTAVTEKQQDDPFLAAIGEEMEKNIQPLEEHESALNDEWTYIPDRLQTDSAYSQTFLLDSALIQFKMWQFEDSLHTINALYNWFDCLGDQCAGISIGDAVNVSTNSFMLLEDNHHIYFIMSPATIQERQWSRFIERNIKNSSWNYKLLQIPGGQIQWKVQPD